MANHRTAWHFLFVASLAEHGAPGFDVLPELPLSHEPLRADVVVVRRRTGAHLDAKAGTLRALWPLVRHTAVIEFKSPSRPPRPGDVTKLFGYGGQYHALRFAEVGSALNLVLVLVVPRVTTTVRDELRALRLRLRPIAPGYFRAAGRPYDVLVVDLSAVVLANKEELMSIFVESTMLSTAAAEFMEQHGMTTNASKNLADLDDYQDVVRRWLTSLTPAQRLAGLAPSERLAGLAPSERLAGLAPSERLAGLAPSERLEGLPPEDLILALPDDLLRAQSDEVIRKLSPKAQRAIRKRLGRRA